MSGLEKIIEDIRHDADSAAEQILSAARESAEEIVSQAQKEADAALASERKKAESEAKLIVERAYSSAELLKRQKRLVRKQELIAQTLLAAREQVQNMPEADYFEAMRRLAADHADAGEGTLYFSERDRSRMPADFAEKLQAELPAGASLSVSEETRKIDGGIVLSYGGIEENCSIDAMFNANREELQDLVHKRLFTEEHE